MRKEIIDLVFVTRNKEKFLIASDAIKNSSLHLVVKKIDCEEVQADDVDVKYPFC